MNLLDIALAKAGAADLSTEEKSLIQDAWTTLTDEQKTKFADIAPEPDVDEVKLKALITDEIAKKVQDLEVTEKIATAATEVHKSLTEQRSKAIHATVVPAADAQAQLKSFFKAVLTDDRATLKALNTGTSSAGGYTVPRDLSLDIIRNAALTYGAARRLFTNYTFNGAGNTVDLLKEGDGINAYWTNEGAAKSSSQPSFSIVSLALKKLATIVPFTDEMLEDSGFDLIGYVKELAARGFAKEEDAAFLMGTGTPYAGLMNDPNVNIVRAAGTDTAAITVDKLQEMIDALPSTFLPGAKFAGNRKARSIIRMLKDTTNNFIFSPATAGNPSSILGYDFEEVDAMPDLTTDGNDKPILAFGNFKIAGTVATKGTLTVKELTEATITDVDGETNLNLAEQDMTALRFVSRVGFLLKQPKAVVVFKTVAA